MRSDDLYTLPPGVPVPEDDGAARHLVGLPMPPVALRSTRDRLVRLDRLGPGRTVIYAYPRTGVPDEDSPPGWDEIPGARGCTPQNCSFRDHHADLRALGADVFGLSTQDTAYQREMTERLHLPFEVLSDERLELARALNLPTFVYGEWTLLKRFSMIVRDGRIEHVFYPVFPPGGDGRRVLAWLAERAR